MLCAIFLTSFCCRYLEDFKDSTAISCGEGGKGARMTKMTNKAFHHKMEVYTFTKH